jgi:hypothetical protein
MPDTEKFSFVKQISPRLAALLDDAEALDPTSIDFADIFQMDGAEAITEPFLPNAEKEKEVFSGRRSNPHS